SARTPPHVALKTQSRTLDRRTTRHVGYDLSQRARKRIDEVFGWMKTARALVQSGADVRAHSTSGFTPLLFAVATSRRFTCYWNMAPTWRRRQTTGPPRFTRLRTRREVIA